jgi:DNA topoisomerase-1
MTLQIFDRPGETQRPCDRTQRFLRDIAGVGGLAEGFPRAAGLGLGAESARPREPATSKRARRRQVLDAIRAAANDLGNTPAICGKSYVHN